MELARIGGLLPVVVTTLAAQIIPVSGGGTALINAVSNAPAGAVLVVAPGSYYPFTAVGNLTIVAPNRATIAYAPTSPGLTYTAATGTSPAQPMKLVGLDFVAVGGGDGEVSGSNLHMQDCTAGSVQIQGGTLWMADCLIASQSDVALRANLAQVALVDSTFTGGTGFDPYYGSYWAQPSLRMAGSNLRAERIVALSGAPALGGFGLMLLQAYPSGLHSTATVADSTLLTSGGGGALSVDCMTGSTVTLSNTATASSVNCVHALAPLLTLRWETRQWALGGTSTVRSHHLPSTVTALVVSEDLVPLSSPLLQDPAFLGSSNWWFQDLGVSDAAGEYQWTVTLPATPALQHASAWLHAVSVPSMQVQVSAPLGGPVR